MRRTARALSVAVLAGAALVIAGPAASADPTPGASPGIVEPDATPSVSVPCDALTGLVPDTTDAAPPASLDGSAQCDEGQGQGQGRGLGQGETPGLVPGEREESGVGQETGQWQEPGEAQETTGSGQGQEQGREQGQGQGQGREQGQGQGQGQGQRPDQGRECQGGTRTCSDGSAQCREPGQCHGDEGDGQKCAAARSCTDDHQCEGSHGDSHGDSHGAADDGDCGRATGGHGVEAGAGGSFSDSVPALVAGSVLIATACAGAGYRLCGRRRSMDG
ncbi:hypothetical protein [Streptomyces diastatochromogenes]|uniref:hypothetical protein n=1 Tax=Streptomyces diastatochromogenes TaxID=42236 RepID=UPI0036A3A5AB